MFRVYYADGSTFSGDAADAPALEALLIVEPDKDHGRRIIHGADYFIWDNGRWYAVDQWGMVMYMVRPGLKRVLYGRMVEHDAWRDIWITANEDPDFPVRTAFGAFEQKPE